MTSFKTNFVIKQHSVRTNNEIGNTDRTGKKDFDNRDDQTLESEHLYMINMEGKKRLASSPVLGSKHKERYNRVSSQNTTGKSLAFSPKGTMQQNLRSPAHKKIKNMQRVSFRNGESLVSESQSTAFIKNKNSGSVFNESPSTGLINTKKRELLLSESPSTAFINTDDSLMDSIDFDELDTICSDMMSTPKSSALSQESKRTPLSNKSNWASYNLRNTPRRLCDDVLKKSVTKSDRTKVSDNILICKDSENIHNVSGTSSLGEFCDDSPDLFEATPKKNHLPDAPPEQSNYCNEIEDIFAESFGATSDLCEPYCEVKVISKNNCNNDKSKDMVQNDSRDSVKISPSFVPPLAVNTPSSESGSASMENTSMCESQMSFTSTADSQPLVGRLQLRLNVLKSSQLTEVVQTETDLREKAMAAALEEAEKVHDPEKDFEAGPFFGLPSKVAEVLKQHRGISDLYDWQKNCIAEGSGTNNLLFSLPTSGGKTLVAEVLMLRQLLLKKKDVIFILPFVALVQEKVHGLSPFGVDLGFLIEEYAASRGNFPPKAGRKKKVLYICTIEKASALVNSLLETDRIGELGLVVADEVHMIGEGSGRGATLEGTITKLRYSSPKIQIVAMSATIGNLREIASFLDAKLFTGDFRPIKLSEYVKIGDQIWELNSSARTEEELLHNKRLCCFPYTREQKHMDNDMIAGLVGEVVPDHSCIVFCATRRNCETLAELICRVLPKELTKNKLPEKLALYKAIVEEGGGTVCPTLRKTLPYGLAYHHSGLTEGERRLIEEGYLYGTLCCLCCTSTLAAGVNLPARRVVIRSPYTGSEFLTRSRYKQMVGRAGRAGLDTSGESFLVLQQRDLKRAADLLLAPMDVCRSTLLQRDCHGLILLLFSSLGLGVAVTLSALKVLTRSSLLSIQSAINQTDLENKVVEIIKKLLRKGLVQTKNFSNSQVVSSAPSSSVSDSESGTSSSSGRDSKEDGSEKLDVFALETPIDNDEILSVSRLGRAAIKGNIDLDLASVLYNDLKIARESLAVNCHLHLLYLVVPYDIATTVKVVPDVLYKEFLDLGEDQIKVAKVLGITEGVLIKLTMGQKSKKIPENVLQRFYIALILHQLWLGKGLWEISDHFQMHRGFTQQLLLASSAFASCIHHFCQELEELWAFRDLLATFSRQLSGCCSAELLPLLDLPAVKKGRAKMLYQAGYRTLHDVANADARAMSQRIDHMPHRTATQIINSAKMLLLERAESLQGEADEVLLGLH